MNCRVLLFARYGELAGASSVEVEVPEGATLDQVWKCVGEKVPALKAEVRPLLACDRVYARGDRIVKPGQEIAAFPPVSGG